MRYGHENAEKSNGVVYTPRNVADYVSAQMLRYHDALPCGCVSILDPAAGNGQLLLSMIQTLTGSGTRIRAVGYETDAKISVETEKRLSALFPDAHIEIRSRDFLTVAEENTEERFDYVIANPPYVRAQIMGSKRAQNIARTLSLTGRTDLYYAFLLLAERVLKPDGVAGYITSNKFLTIQAGNSVRNYMIRHYRIHHIVDLGDTKLFDAAVLPCILFFSLGQTTCQDKVHFTSVYQTKAKEEPMPTTDIFDVISQTGCYALPDRRCFQYRQGILRSTEENTLWTQVTPEDNSWLARVQVKTMMTFSCLGKIRVGIKTTADNVFIGDNWSGEKANLELLRPLITHRDAGQILPNRVTQWKALYPHTVENGRTVACNLDAYPHTQAYLTRHRTQLSARTYLQKSHRQWYEIWVPQNPEAWERKKIVFCDISDAPRFWFDAGGAIVNGDCYWIDLFSEISDKLIYLALAVANSHFIEHFYDLKFNTKLYSGKRRYQAQYVEQFPLPSPDSPLAEEATLLVEKIIAENSPKAVPDHMETLNALVEHMFS